MSFFIPVRVYWEDTDAGGIVFYANYLKFFERARTEWLRSAGINQGDLLRSTGGMFVVAQCDLSYLGAARLDDMLQVSAALQNSSRASLSITQQARSEDGQKLLCTASVRLGWVDGATMRPSRIPDSIQQAILEKLT